MIFPHRMQSAVRPEDYLVLAGPSASSPSFFSFFSVPAHTHTKRVRTCAARLLMRARSHLSKVKQGSLREPASPNERCHGSTLFTTVSASGLDNVYKWRSYHKGKLTTVHIKKWREKKEWTPTFLCAFSRASVAPLAGIVETLTREAGWRQRLHGQHFVDLAESQQPQRMLKHYHLKSQSTLNTTRVHFK
jgi:hypothetical protein